MQNRISDQTKLQILSLKIQGLTNQEIHTKTVTSTGAISEITNDFAHKLQIDDPNAAFTFFKLIQKNNIPINVAFDNVVIHSVLSELGLSPDSAKTILDSLNEAMKSTDTDVSQLLNSAAALADMRNKHDISGDGLVDFLQEKKTKLDELETKIKMAKKQEKESQEKLESTLNYNHVTLQQIEEYCAIKDDLQKHDLDITDSTKIATMLKQAESLNYDPKKIIAKLAESETLDNSISIQKKRNLELESSNKTLENTNSSLVEKIKKDTNVVEMIDSFNSLGIGSSFLIQLHEKILEIGKKNNLSPKESSALFYGNLQKQYDAKIGYEITNKELAISIEKESAKLGSIIEQLDTCSKRYDKEKQAIEFLKQLQNNKIAPLSIQKWETIIKRCGLTSMQFHNQIKDIEGLQKFTDQKQRILSELKQKIAELSGQHEELTNQVNKLTGKRKELLNLKDEIQTLIKSALSNCKSQLEYLAIKKLDELGKSIDTKIKSINSVFDDVFDLNNNVAQAREVIARAEFLEPLYTIMVSHSGDLSKTIIILHNLLVNVEIWLSKQSIHNSSLARSVTNLKNDTCKVLQSHAQA